MKKQFCMKRLAVAILNTLSLFMYFVKIDVILGTLVSVFKVPLETNMS